MTKALMLIDLALMFLPASQDAGNRIAEKQFIT
jgi:hypothetical protein